MEHLSIFSIGALALNVFISSFAFHQRHGVPEGRSLLLLSLCTASILLGETISPILSFSDSQFFLSLFSANSWIILGALCLHHIYKITNRQVDIYYRGFIVATFICIIFSVAPAFIGPALASEILEEAHFLLPLVAQVGGLTILCRNLEWSGGKPYRGKSSLVALFGIVSLLLASGTGIFVLIKMPMGPRVGLSASAFSLFCLFGFFSLNERVLCSLPVSDLFENFFGRLSVGTILLDTTGKIRQINPAASRLLGVATESAIGQNITALGLHSPRNHDKRKKDIVLEAPNGSHLLLVSHTSMQQLGKTSYNLLLLRDISNRRKVAAELKSTHDALKVVAETKPESPLAKIETESVIELAQGIAHDFNNLLSAIIGFATAAREDLPAESQLRGDMEEVLAAADKARDIVDQLLNLGAKDEEKRSAIDVNDIVESTGQLLSVSLPENIDIRYGNYTEEITVFGEPTGLTKVLMYFCRVAYDSIKAAGGTLAIRTEKMTLDESFTSSHPPLHPGPHVRFEIASKGSIPEAHSHGKEQTNSNGFEQNHFITEDELSSVLKIIDGHQGTVISNGKRDSGTIVHIYLPALPENALETNVAILGIPGGSEKILLVDDEDQLTRVGKRLLESLGYSVTTLTNSLEAERVFLGQPDLFDMVITDQSMPSMSGVELAQAILAVRKDIPIILLSGHTEQDLTEKVGQIGIELCLTKPISKYRLGMAVRNLLDSHALGNG